MILQTLYQQCIKKDVTFYDEFHVTDLVMDGDSVSGVLALELKTGEIHEFSAKAVLFATGGFGRMFKTTSNALSNTGDGPEIVARAGIPLEDLEFFQFHPTGLEGLGILITEGVRGEGGILRNRSGERFMERYAPTLLDLAPRDMISRAIMTEILDGRGMRGDREIDDYVVLDATHLGKDKIEEKLPDIAEFCRTFKGIEASVSPIPVLPTAHYAMGGIPTDVHGRVTNGKKIYEGLYAAGECACVSVHGANRLGTNSLLDLVVFGKRAGKHISDWVKGAPHKPFKKTSETTSLIERLRKTKQGSNSADLMETMQNTMMRNIGVFRTGKDMVQAVEDMRLVRAQYDDVVISDTNRAFNSELLEILELGNLIDIALLTAISAENRKESRGAHTRDDYPDRNDNDWLKHTLIYLADERIEYKAVTAGKFIPKPRIY
jgi:succinate dehydrogenase / fumarate reductase flavoprotein subunit